MCERGNKVSELPFPSPGDLPDIGIECASYVSCTGRWGLYHPDAGERLRAGREGDDRG